MDFNLLGEHGDRRVLRFSLPIERGRRTSAVRISDMREGVLVEHLVLHEGPNLDAAVGRDVVVDLRAPLGVDAVAEGDVPAEELAGAVLSSATPGARSRAHRASAATTAAVHRRSRARHRRRRAASPSARTRSSAGS